jgi:tetratricopeptide (TPR) repeat protein
MLQSTPEAAKMAERILWNAVRQWPHTAEAYAVLAECLTCSVSAQFAAPRDHGPLIEMASSHALRLGGERGDLHVYTSLPSVSNGDLASAERAIRKALQLSPGNALAHYWGGGILAASGLHEEALAHLKQAIRLQPLAIFFRVGVGAPLYFGGKYKAARQQLLETLEMDPGNVMASHWLGQVSAELRLFEEAEQAATHAFQASGTSIALGGLGYVLARGGRREEAEDVVERLEERGTTAYVPRSILGAIHAALGNFTKAANEVKAATYGREWMTGWYAVDPRWSPIRNNATGTG